MRNFRDGLFFALLAAVLLVGMDQPAHAYLDPGTGSMLLQAAAGGIFVAVVFLRKSWRLLVGLLLSPFKKRESSVEPEQTEHDK
jgi:hypothetical protein